MRAAFVVVLLACSSCAWVFQDHLPSEYSGHSEPLGCSTSNGWATADGVFAVLNVVSTIAVAADGSAYGGNTGAYVVGGVVGAVVHVASAITGAKWSSECREAWADWQGTEGELSQREELERRRLKKQLESTQPAAPPEPVAPPAPPAPRGFFCASSPSNAAVNFCEREKAACERSRDISIDAIPDLSACTLTETAWCFEGRCSLTQATCETKRKRAIEQSETPEECDEER